MKGSTCTICVASTALFFGLASAQTFQRLGACPKLGCIFPPDQADFLAGAKFDIRLEVHAPINGSEAFNGGVPDKNFTFVVKKEGGQDSKASDFFKKPEPGENLL
jgi:hypothetical protein